MKNKIFAAEYQNTKEVINRYKSATEQSFITSGQQMAWDLFNDMSAQVPAYKNMISTINRDAIVTFTDIPTIDKETYLRKYNREELCFTGDLKHQSWVFSSTSGSTGEPFYFPRQSEQDDYYAITAEIYLRENFQIDTKSTLYIVAFPMGAWIGGLFTYEALHKVAQKGYPLSIITPGINKLEIIKAVKALAPEFDQIIIGSYAPFLSDILNDGTEQGINWQKINTKFVFSAESFSEEFRDYVAKTVGLENIYKDTLNHYGTVDLGTMAHETPYTILIRRLALQNMNLYRALFGSDKIATLCQYDPNLFFFESINGGLLCSSYSGYPLCRYDLKDRGGILTNEHIKQLFSSNGIDLDHEITVAGLSDSVWNLPFVFVYERSDFTVSFYAFQIYPETLKKILLDESIVNDVTGKFSMEVQYDTDGQQQFVVHIELRSNKEAGEPLEQKLQKLIFDALTRENSEFRKTCEELGADRLQPQISIWPYEDSTYFKPGGKQKWIKK